MSHSRHGLLLIALLAGCGDHERPHVWSGRGMGPGAFGGRSPSCQQREQSSASAGPKLRQLGLAAPSSCAEETCDPACQEFLDAPDETLGGDGIVVDSTGIRLDPEHGTPDEREQRPNGPISADVEDFLEQVGELPGAGFFYHELLPGESSQRDTLSVEAEIRTIDVYFLLDTSATMGEALVSLGEAVGGDDGVIASVEASFPNARFGVGHFHGYQAPPHDVSAAGGVVRPLWHSLNLGADASSAENVMLWLGDNGTTSNNNSTEAFGIALYASATSEGLVRGGLDPDYYWVAPRNASSVAYEWFSDYAGSAPPAPEGGPCPSGSIGYPCFGASSTPITIVMTDNPTENGPGGQFAYGHPSAQSTKTPTGGIAGSTPWPDAVELDATSNGLEQNAVTIEPGRFERYAGNLANNGAPASGRRRVGGDSNDGVTYTSASASFSSERFPTTVPGDTKLADCSASTGDAGREAFFAFSLAETAFVHFDTWGSERDVILYVIDRDTRERVACNDDVSFIHGSALSGMHAQMRRQASLEARLSAGSYVLVLDEKKASPGASSRYFLQVNAMDDAAPVAVPSFEQMALAEQSLGGKVIGIDVSGMGPIDESGDGFEACDCGATGKECESPTHAINRWTYLHLQEAARRSGSVDGTDANPWTNPFVFSMDKLGGPCHDGVDPSIGTQVSEAIADLTRTLRQDISVEARDSDDGSDFDHDGAATGVSQLTPFEVDEGPSADHPHGLFIASAVVVPQSGLGNGSHDLGPDGSPRCLDDAATPQVLEGCLPDTRVRFDVTFAVPAAIEQRDELQIFTFDVATVGSGQGVLGSKTAVIVVPPRPGVLLEEGWFVRDYDLRGECGWDRAVVWGSWFWQAETPADSAIDFFVRVARSEVELDAAEELELRFSDPPGPSALVGEPVSARAGIRWDPLESTCRHASLSIL